jgi:hypothetical protein
MSARTADLAVLLQYVAQCLPPVAVAELRSREHNSPQAADEGQTTFQVLSVSLFDARRKLLLKLGLFRRWRAHTKSRRRLVALLERAKQLSDDRRMRAALQLWAATAFESRLSAVLLSRGLALVAVLLASAAQVVPGQRTTVTTSASLATSFFTYGAALYHAQRTALLATAPARPSRRGRLVPALRGSVASTTEVQQLSWQQLRQQLAAALTAVRERDAWLRDLRAEHDAAQEAARSAALQLQQQTDETEHWCFEARRWEEAHGVARGQLDDTQGLLHDSCAALERLQTSELTYAMQLARAQSECKHLEAQLGVSEAGRAEAARVAASLTVERDVLRESLAAARATAEAQLGVSEAGRAEAEEAYHTLRAALQGADSQAAAMLVAASAEKAELAAQLEKVEARLRQMEAVHEMMLARFADAASPEPQLRTSALSPLVLSRVMDRMSLVHAQLERVEEFGEQQQVEATLPAVSPAASFELTDASGDQQRFDAALRDAHGAREQLAALQTRCSSLEAALEAATASGLASASEVTALQGRLEDALRHIAVLEAQLADMAERLSATEAARDAATADALRATAELARSRMDVRLAKAAADSAQRRAQSQGVRAAPDPPDAGPTPEGAAQLTELRAALADAEARSTALSREVDSLTAERERMAAQLRERMQEGTANRSDDVQTPAAGHRSSCGQLAVAIADALPSALATALDARRLLAAQRLPLGKLEAVLWVRGPGADTPTPPSHGPPQFVWVKHAATLWSSGVLKLVVDARSDISRRSGQEERRPHPAGLGTSPSGIDTLAEVDLTACGDVVIASKDSYRHTSLRDRKRYCFHVIRPDGELALAAACGNDAETREWADLMRLFIMA